MAEINDMQANMGLSAAEMGPIGIPTPSPADVSLRLSMESASRQQQAQQSIQSTPLGAPTGFRAQFERQMSLIQAQQSLNPYAAQRYAQQSQQSQQQQYLPSPLTMTPPSTGVFRPPPPAPAITPLPPVYTPSFRQSPFTPQAPTPMFSSPHEQRIQQDEIRSNRDFSMMSQAPSIIGQGMGLMAGAAAGAKIGSRFGRWGGVVGAGVGAVAAGASGLAEGMGNIGQRFMQPAIEQRRMGAGLQNMSQNWVTSGADVSPLGRGLSQDASNNLAGQIQNMASDSSFQKQTGGMFNRQDLMQITRKSGENGLMDMAQDVPQIKQQLKQTATTIKQFMELTNDPDVSNVIRQMGRMRQFGMTQQDMTDAAQGMKTYSRAAGTSIEGLQQIGGLPGAATFQQAGLTAGQGFKYGNFAAASAQQLVASGGVDPRQLALMGGVQGMAQRDMQGQAAMGSMPLFAAANAQYGSRGWGMGRGGQQAAEGGAFGMVHGALRNMNQAVQQGGIGALASFPLKQREIADKALSEMTPQEQMAQRFSSAMSTGQRLGMKGEQAFSTGARLMYGDDVATQMLHQAKSPEYWKSQRQMLKQRKQELGQETMWRAEQESPILGGVPRDAARSMGFTGRGSWGEGVGNFFEGVGEGAGSVTKAIGSGFGGIGESWNQYQAKKEGIIRTKLTSSAAAATSGVKESGMGAYMESAKRGASGRSNLFSGYGDVSGAALVNAANLEDDGATGLGVDVAETIAWADPTGVIGSTMGEAGAWIGANASRDQKEQRSAVKKYVKTASRSLEILDEAKKVGGKDPKVVDAMNSIDDAMGSKGSGMSVIEAAANALDQEVYDRGSNGKVLSEKDYEAAVKKGLQDQGLSPAEAKTKLAELKKSGALSNVISQTVHFAKKGSRDPELWTETQEKDHREAIRDQTSKSTAARQEGLRESISDVEDTLDLDSTFGGSESYSEEEEKVQKMAAKHGGKGFALRVAAAEAFTGDKDDRDLERWKELTKGMDSEEILALRKEAEGMDEDMQERLIDIGSRGDTETITKYGETQHAIGMQGAWGSEGFMESVGKYSADLESVVAGDTGEITAQKVAGAFTDDELKKMSREGGAGGRRMAKLLQKAKGGDKKAAALLEKHAAEQADIDEEGVEETSGVKGEGKEAQEVEAADAAMADMQKMFAGFGPATKDFAFGAKALAEAMDNHEIGKRED